MNVQKKISEGRVALMRGQKKSPKFINEYESAIWQQALDTRYEIMVLYIAEMLHDRQGYDTDQVMECIVDLDNRMAEFTETKDLDAIRIRVYEKIHMIFAATKEEQERIAGIMREKGFEVNLN